MDSLIKTVLDEKYYEFGDFCFEELAKSLSKRIEAKKTEVKAKLNGLSLTEMSDLISKNVMTEEIHEDFVNSDPEIKKAFNAYKQAKENPDMVGKAVIEEEIVKTDTEQELTTEK